MNNEAKIEKEIKLENVRINAFIKTMRNAAEIYKVDLSEIEGVIKGIECGTEWEIGGDYY